MLLYLFIEIHMLCLHRALLMLIVEIGLGVIVLWLMHLGKHAIVLPLFIMHVMLLLYSHAKMQKCLLENWDLNARETRLAFGFQKLL
jgi:ABC-type phosphate/phosphonate transport system permease subunit